MRKWLSLLGYILGIVVAIFLLSPLLLGLLAEKKCRQIVETINATTPLVAKVTNYQRGWFSANATAQISLEKLELANQKLQQVTVTAHISHGPILIDWKRFHIVQAIISADINFNEEQNRLLNRAPNAEPIAVAKIKLRLNGDTTITLESPPFNYQDQNNNIYWQGLTIRSNFSPLGNQVKSNLDFPGMEIVNKNFTVHLGAITSAYQGHKTSAGLWIGERSLRLNSFSTKNENNHTIALEGLDLHNIITEEQKNFANVTTTITVNNININNGFYYQNKLDFELNKLNQTLLTKLQQQLLSSKIISSPGGIGFDTLIAILSNGCEIKIKEISTNTPWGKFLAAINIAFANQPNSIGILAVLANSTVNADIKAERALALHLLEKFYQIVPSQKESNPEKQAESLLNDWQQSGKITASDKDNYLHLIFDYKNNRPSINNKLLILTTQP